MKARVVLYKFVCSNVYIYAFIYLFSFKKSKASVVNVLNLGASLQSRNYVKKRKLLLNE